MVMTPLPNAIQELDTLISYCNAMEYDYLKIKLFNIKTKLEMSFSSETVKNPATKFLEFKSDDKAFTYWDKEEKKNVPVKLPLNCIVLDELSVITGFSDDLGCGFYSNEVQNLSKEPFYVKSFKPGFVKEGLYNDIKDALKAEGAKFGKSLYVLHLSDEKPEIVSIKLSGAAMAAWIDAKIDTRSNIVVISDQFSTGKKGKTEYNVPIFETAEIDADVRAVAVKADGQLQEYFKAKKRIADQE